MGNKILNLALTGLMACIIYTGCQNAGEERDQIAENRSLGIKTDSQAARIDNISERQKFKSASELKIRFNENKITAFKEKIKKSGTKLKAKYKKEIADLELANRNMEKKLDDFKDEGATAWEDFKTEFNKDMDKIGKAINDITSGRY